LSKRNNIFTGLLLIAIGLLNVRGNKLREMNIQKKLFSWDIGLQPRPILMMTTAMLLGRRPWPLPRMPEW
jgi:hypothetical protein